MLLKTPQPLKNLLAKIGRDKAFAFIKEISRAFPRAEVFLVGGIVRDALLKRQSKDYDFVARGVPREKLEKLLQKHGRVDFVGRLFGVYKFSPKNGALEEPIDIALPRAETAWGTGGYRDVDAQSDPNLPIELDLSRRDFTINAMALSLASGKKKFNKRPLLIDPFDGLADLKNKIIRAAREPKERFKEDYSRMLRALRFACQLNFKIEPQTWKAILQFMPEINLERKVGGETERVIPFEVIAKELVKAFTAAPAKALDLFDQSGAIKELMPELLAMKDCPQPKNYHAEGDVWTHTRLALSMLESSGYKKFFGKEKASAEVILAALFHDIAKPVTIQTPETHGTDRIRFHEHDLVGADMARKIIERLRLSSAPDFGINADRIHWLILHHLLLVHGEAAEKMKASTVEKYFFSQTQPSDSLLKLMYADGAATIPESGRPLLNHFTAIRKRMADLRRGRGRKKKALPSPLLNGDDVMRICGLKPGPAVGELLTVLREAQLEKKIKNRAAAEKLLKENCRSAALSSKRRNNFPSEEIVA